jgi:hypothetical protein
VGIRPDPYQRRVVLTRQSDEVLVLLALFESYMAEPSPLPRPLLHKTHEKLSKAWAVALSRKNKRVKFALKQTETHAMLLALKAAIQSSAPYSEFQGRLIDIKDELNAEYRAVLSEQLVKETQPPQWGNKNRKRNPVTGGFEKEKTGGR